MRGSVTTESLSREVHDAAEAYGFGPRANTGLESRRFTCGGVCWLSLKRGAYCLNRLFVSTANRERLLVFRETLHGKAVGAELRDDVFLEDSAEEFFEDSLDSRAPTERAMERTHVDLLTLLALYGESGNNSPHSRGE